MQVFYGNLELKKTRHFPFNHFIAYHIAHNKPDHKIKNHTFNEAL